MFEKLFENREKESLNDRIYSGSIFSDIFGTNTPKNDLYYNRCINALAETVAKIPICVYKKQEDNNKTYLVEDESFYLNELFKNRPNDSLTMFETLKNFIGVGKDQGMSGLFIKRDFRGKVIGLYPVRIDGITVDKDGIIFSNKQNKVLVDYSIDGYCGSCFEKDIIFFRDNTIYNPLHGYSNKMYTKDIIDSNVEGQKYQAKLFKNNLTGKIVAQTVTDIKDDSELKKIKRRFNKLLNSDMTDEEGNSRVSVIPAGYNILPLNLNLADSQFAELKLQGKQDICNAISVPIKLIDGTISEDEMNNFYNTIIDSLLTQIQEEMNSKLLTEADRKKGYKIKFNISAVLKTNLSKQQQILCGYRNAGIYTTNQCLSILGLPPVEGGDILTFPSGQMTAEQLQKGQLSYIQNDDKPIDNNINDEGGENKDE